MRRPGPAGRRPVSDGNRGLLVARRQSACARRVVMADAAAGRGAVQIDGRMVDLPMVFASAAAPGAPLCAEPNAPPLP